MDIKAADIDRAIGEYAKAITALVTGVTWNDIAGLHDMTGHQITAGYVDRLLNDVRALQDLKELVK